MGWRTLLVIGAVTLGASGVAGAGDDPIWGASVKKAEAAWAKYCGGSLTIVVKEGFRTAEEKRKVLAVAQDLASIAQYKCPESAEAKANYAGVKTFVVQRAKDKEETGVTRSGSTVTGTQALPDQNWINDLMITRLVDPFRPQRQFIASDVQPAIDKAAEIFQSACGCKVAVTLALESYRSPQDPDRFLELEKARNTAVDIRVIGSYCSGEWELESKAPPAAVKKAVCAMKSLAIENGPKGKGPRFQIAGGKGRAIEDFTDVEVSGRKILEGLGL